MSSVFMKNHDLRKTLDIKRYSSHNFQDIITSFGHKVDMTIYMLTWYRFFDKWILRGFIDKIPIYLLKSIIWLLKKNFKKKKCIYALCNVLEM